MSAEPDQLVRHADTPRPEVDARPARQSSRRGRHGVTSRSATRSTCSARPRSRASRGAAHRRWASASPISPSCVPSTASTSRPSRRSTPSRSAISQPAAGSPTAKPCCCWARPASARRIWRWPSAARRSRLGFTVLFAPATDAPRHTRQGPRRRAARGAARVLRQAQAARSIDELGYLPFEPDAAHLFFQLVSRRYERGSLLVTSNRSVGEWGTVFGDPVVATAILDRLLHHSHVITIRGDSYRLRESAAPASSRPRRSARSRPRRPDAHACPGSPWEGPAPGASALNSLASGRRREEPVDPPGQAGTDRRSTSSCRFQSSSCCRLTLGVPVQGGVNEVHGQAVAGLPIRGHSRVRAMERLAP